MKTASVATSPWFDSGDFGNQSACSETVILNLNYTTRITWETFFFFFNMMDPTPRYYNEFIWGGARASEVFKTSQMFAMYSCDWETLST